MIEKEKRHIIEEYIYLLTVIIAVFFIGSKYSILTIVVLLLLLFFLIIREMGRLKVPMIALILGAYMFLILFQLIIDPSKYFDMQIAVKELQRIIIYILIALIVDNTEIKESRFINFWSIIFLISVFIAILQFYKIPGVFNVLESLYGSSIFLDIARKYYTFANFRAGSLFINPNSYSKFIVLFISIYITIFYRTNKKNKIFIMGFLILLSLILAGSRTGLVISLILLLNKYIQHIMYKKLSMKRYYMLILPIILFAIAVGIFFISTSDIIDLDNIRILKVLAGVSNSISYKYRTFGLILNEFNILNVFIGLGPFMNDLWELTLIDFDFGYQIAFFGFAGFILYILMIRDFYQKLKPNIYEYHIFYMSLVIVFIVFGFSGGIFFNLRFFSTYLTMIYANINYGVRS